VFYDYRYLYGYDYDAYRQFQCPANHYPYTIQPGDTLNQIAARLEVAVSRILAANPGLDSNNLQIARIICIPACPPNHSAYVIEQGDTLYRIAAAYRVSVASIMEANPGIEPNSLRVGQRICIPSVCAAVDPAAQATIDAMQQDIDKLVAESSIQQTEQANYGTSTRTTRAAFVTERELRFDAVPVTFSGEYFGRYTAGRSYPYYIDAAMGGRRAITVRDNFGVWHTFPYREMIG